MRLSQTAFIRNLILAGLSSLLAACAATTQVHSTNPNISIKPSQEVNQVQISLLMTAPKDPAQYTNANAAAANGASSSNIKNSEATGDNDQVFNSLSTPTNSQSSSVTNDKNTQELYNAKIHAIASLRPQIESILTQYGFVPVPYESKIQRKLTVQIMDLSNSDGLHATVEVDAINGMLTYSRSYSGATSDALGSLGAQSTKLIGDLLTQGLGDAQLISFLSQS